MRAVCFVVFLLVFLDHIWEGGSLQVEVQESRALNEWYIWYTVQ